MGDFISAKLQYSKILVYIITIDGLLRESKCKAKLRLFALVRRPNGVSPTMSTARFEN